MAFRNLQSLLKSLPVIKQTTSSGLSGPLRNIAKSPALAWNFGSSSSVQFQQWNASNSFNKVVNPLFLQPQRNFHLLRQISTPLFSKPNFQSNVDLTDQQRTVTKFSIRKGKRKTVKAVIRRFYRLDWGIWIKPKSGRHRHLWRKGKLRKKRLRQHVFTNAWHTRTLERMTTKYWHKKKYWVDDPYENYHTREDFPITKGVTSLKPKTIVQ